MHSFFLDMNMRDANANVFGRFGLILACVMGVGLSACCMAQGKSSEGAVSSSPRTRLDAGWLFHLGDISPDNQVITNSYADGQWRHVDVPNDYVLDAPFNQAEDRGHGYRHFDVGWYRKHFFIPTSDQGKILRLDFDGVFRDSKVWVNGQLLGEHLSGYTPFSYDITKVAKLGAENIVVVRVDPRKFEGWWYEGGGIYRHVYLTALAPVHVAHWGTYVVSTVPGGDQGADGQADLTIQTTVENNGARLEKCQVVSEIVGPDGQSVQKLNSDQSMGASDHQQIVQHTTIQNPKLWSIQSPLLYQLRTTIICDGKPTDSTVTNFGIRTIHYDPNKGFFLNGKHVEIQGTANHQDLAGVGIAVPDSLQAWRVEQLKNVGCNAWRTAHNPPNEALLDACDRMGMMVMDENRHLGDAYSHHSPKGTTANDLSDLATMIQRDRNHPSIIMWSMCNEEGLSASPEGQHLFSAMMNVVHRYDRSRPITCAINGNLKRFVERGIAGVEDIIGVNYNVTAYDAIHHRFPNKAMFGSEDTNEKTTRGQYADDRAAAMSSGYNLSDKNWLAVATRPFMAGSFTWTGFDYKGEPNPYGWPDISNNTGLMDGCGFPKDKYYYFESCWSPKPMVHLMPDSWNSAGKEGKTIRVVAFSNASRIELFLNGKSLGAQDMPHDGHLEWQVPYQPGQLLAKAYNDSKIVATEELATTGVPARIELRPARTTLRADGEDAVVIPVSILDNKDRVNPDATNRVTFHLTGGGRILGVGNGNPADHDPDKSDQRNAFHGRCMVVIEAGTKPATMHLTATSPGLASDKVSFEIR